METGAGAFFNWDSLIVQPVQSVVTQIMTFLPRLAFSLVVLLPAGWFIAKAVESLVVTILKRVGFDKLADQTQLSTILAKGGIRHKLSELVGVMVYWLIMLVVVVVVFNALQLMVAAELFGSVVKFLPQVVAAVFLLVLGIFAAAFLGVTVRTAASNAGIAQSQLLGEIVQIAVVVSAAVAALEQLGIQFVGEVFMIILGGISLGCAIAFGLGCKDLAGRWLSDIVDQIQGRKR